MIAPSRFQLSAKVFVACGLWLVVLGMYFLVLRPALLPEEPRSIGSSLEAIRSVLPGLERWLNHVFDVMGGFMIATGAITVLVACRMPEVRSSLMAVGNFSFAVIALVRWRPATLRPSAEERARFGIGSR